MVNKKGQISIFVIIGIILIIVVGFLFVNSKFEIFVDHETKMMNQVTDIVDDCLQKATNDGVFQLGFQGGVIEIPANKLADPRKHTDLGLIMPNWDSQIGDVPSVNSMETELQNYIQKAAYACITVNLATLNDVFEMDVEKNLVVNSKINEQTVIVDAYLPITFSEIGSEQILSIENYNVKLEAKRLGDMFTLASEIFNIEGKQNFIEELVMDQIYSASDYTSKESMPSEGMSFSCTPRVWTIPQLKKNLANLNNNNFKYLYFKGTRPIDDVIEANLNDELGTSYAKTYFENFYQFDLGDTKSSYSNYKVEVFMPSAEVTGSSGILQEYPYRKFEVRPSDGLIVKSVDMKVDVAGGKIPIPCVQIFHSLYDLDYDLIVKITDFNDDGNRYVFQFPLRVEVESNTPKEGISYPMINLPETTATDSKFCSDESRQYPLRVFSLDSSNDEVLDEVKISYKCVNLNCELGETSKPFYHGFRSQHSQSVLETDFPYCVGGTVIAEKEGYYRGKVKVDTDSRLIGADPIPYYDVYLTPLKKFKVNVGSFVFSNGIRVRDESDGQVFVTITNDAFEFSSSVLWPTEEGILDTLEFLDKDDIAYNVSVLYTDADSELRGIFDIKNWKPDIHSGNNIEVTIPVSEAVLTEDTFMPFYEESNAVVELGETYGIRFN